MGKRFNRSTFNSEQFNQSTADGPPTLVISNVAVSNVTADSALITWDTNVVADSQVQYGFTIAYGSSSTLDPTMVTNHSVLLTGLSGDSFYHFRVRSEDGTGDIEFSGDGTFTTSSGPPVPLPTGILNLSSGGNDWTERCDWGEFKLTFRKDVGVAATFALDTTGVIGIAPGCEDEFTLTMPTGEKFIMVPVGEPGTLYRQDAHDINQKVTVHTYELIDIVSALDRVPLPTVQFIESNAGEILSTLIASLNPVLDTTGIQTGNDVPYLDTKDFSKFSEVAKHASIQTGGYTVQIDPNTNGGYAVIADFNDNFGQSGITVDKDNVYVEGVSVDFTPQKDKIEPDNNIINVQRVKSTQPGPHHTGIEFRELEALVPSFKLKALPFGLDGNELLNFQIDDGSIAGADSSDLPNIIPLHHPVQVEVADISLTGGGGTVCGFIGRGGTTVLALAASGGSIGAVVSGASYMASTPFVTGGAAPDLNHQYYYDFHALWTAGGLVVTITENYLNNLAGETVLATVTSVDLSTGTIGLSLAVGSVNDLPASIRFFANGDPGDVRGFTTITERSGSTIVIDNVPTNLVVGDKLASGDSASVTTTDQTVYNGAAPANRYGKPQLIISGGSGITARQWTASYGPAVEMTLLPNPYTGAPGRVLKVGTPSSKSADIAIAASGNTAVCTFVGDRLPLTGAIRLLINYDVAKIIDVTVEDAASQARCGIRQGEIIESPAVLTDAEATALGNAVLSEFADPKPKGTIKRESSLTNRMPLPNELVPIDLPSEYMITAADVPISDVSVDFGGYDWTTNDGVLIYNISIGNIDAQEAIDRQLLANQTAQGIQYRPLSAPGSRISSATWNDVDTVTLGVSGSIALNGKPASSSFNPADYATGNLREAPVALAGTVTSGGIVSELLVEVIYPPLDVDAASATCLYSAKTNLVTFRWGRPAGALEYWIKRLVDDGTNTETLVFKQVDKIFNEAYPLPYEPASKKIQIQTIGLADKKGAGGYIEIECILPTLPAPSLFDVKKFKHNDTIVFEVSPPPLGSEITGRAKFLRVLVSENPSTPPVDRGDFDTDDDDIDKYEFIPPPGGNVWRLRIKFTDTEADDTVYVIACWVDGFLDEGDATVPFDATMPPMTVGFISVADFFQSASQANGGTIEDDNELTGQTEFSGVFRYHLGRHNSNAKIVMEESEPMSTTTEPPVWSGRRVKGNEDPTDDDALNGYVDVDLWREFRFGRKRWRAYRPVQVTVRGVNAHERLGPLGEETSVQEMMYLVGYDGTGAPPALEPHVVDGVFDYNQFVFIPGINGLANNYITPLGGRIRQISDGFKYIWDIIEDAGLRRFVVIISTSPFGTKGPGTDSGIATDLNALDGEGQIQLYGPSNTGARNVVCKMFDRGLTHHVRFDNGDVIDGMTITAGSQYYVSVIAQKKNGRWSSDFAIVFDSVSGLPISGNDVADAGPVQNQSMFPWSTKKGWRSIWNPPTSNWNAPRGYIVSYYTTVSGTTSWMSPETGALLAQTTGDPLVLDERNIANTGGVQVYVRVTDNRHTTGLGKNDALLNTIFKTNPVIAKIRAINRQGAVDVISANAVITNSITAGEDSTTAVPGLFTFPAGLVDNNLDGDPETNLARLVISLTTANGQSMFVNNINGVELGIVRRNANNSLDVGNMFTVPLIIGDNTASTIQREFYLKVGQRYRILYVASKNGDKQNITPVGALDFLAGGILTSVLNDPLAPTVPPPVFGTITAENGSNKVDLVPITITQPAQAVWLKRLVIEANQNNTGWGEEKDIVLKKEDLLNKPSGTYSRTFRVKRQAGTTVVYRATVYAVGGNFSTTPTAARGVSAADLSFDTAAPVGAGPNGTIIINRAKFKKGSLLVDFVMPSQQMNTHWKNVLVLHDNNATGTGRKYYDPITSSWVTAYPDSTTELVIGKGGIQGLGIFKSEVFVGGRTNLYVRIGVWNQFNGGAATYSPDVGQTGFIGPITLTNSENEAPSDQSVPDAPPTPTVKEQYGEVIVKAKAPASGVGANLITKWQMAVTNANTAPTSADPPTSGASLFSYEEGVDGTHKWRFNYSPNLENRYFWVRCKNANNSTGGPGNNGWSAWCTTAAVLLSVNQTRPLQDEIGTGPPDVLAGGSGNSPGYSDVGGTQQIGGPNLPINAYDDGLDAIFELLLPTPSTTTAANAQNAFSLTSIQYQIYKANTATLRASGTIHPDAITVVRFPLINNTLTFRFRMKNKYRAGGSSGWSSWTAYARHVGTVGTPLNNYPGPDVQIQSDFLGENSYPSRYTTP